MFSEKASAIARIRQKCVRNASKMRQKCVKNASEIIGKRGTSKMRQKCVKIASKVRGAPLGENTFWTIPKEGKHDRKNKDILAGEKSKEFQKSKERKDREWT